LQAGPVASIMWNPIMRTIKTFAIVFSLALAGGTMAHAEDKCDAASSTKGVETIKNGKKYLCDTCVTLGCDTSGPTIGKCTKKTKTTCVEAPDKPGDKKK
jgi:hypothetical protein